MIRRRRRTREIPFSFDSFLDVVANVVGIILRLILVTWVGARAYTGLQAPPPPVVESVEEHVLPPEPEDPLTPELERQRRELADAEKKLLDELRQWEQAHGERAATASDLADLRRRVGAISSERAGLENAKKESGGARDAALLSVAQIRERNQRLLDEIAALRKEPPAKQTLRYRTPISHPLQTEEIHFECKAGRVTLIDVGAMLEEVRRGLRDKAEALRATWELRDLTQPVGAFRLSYVVEREHDVLDALKMGAKPNQGAAFQYGLAAWEVVPIQVERGETEDAALATGSAFRRVVDALDVNQTAVTLWVYPDSFALYRRLRDYLHDRDVTVAGRALPDGVPIGSSRHGTVSRGQ
jgi:hypothetical protein